MNHDSRQFGFSLIETMLAVGILAIGMVFVAGTFMTGVYFASVATERTIATVVTDEAMTKIVLRGMDPNNPKLKVGSFVPYEDIIAIDPCEACYPSMTGRLGRDYSWSAICRREQSDGHLVEFSVFVSRLVGLNARYWVRGSGTAWPSLQQTSPPISLPRPVKVHVTRTAGMAANELLIQDAVPTDTVDENTFLDSGFVIVDDATGLIYRVMERYGATPNRVRIDPAWSGAATDAWVWAMPRPVSGGRSPLVGVYQKVIRF